MSIDSESLVENVHRLLHQAQLGMFWRDFLVKLESRLIIGAPLGVDKALRGRDALWPFLVFPVRRIRRVIRTANRCE